MKFTATLLLSLLPAAFGAPAFTLRKRASLSEAATVGYATLNGGTTGGAGGPTTTVSSLSALKTAATKSGALNIVVKGTIAGNDVVDVAADKTIVGADGKAVLQGVGLRVKDVKNVIIRNLEVRKVLASTGDAIGIQKSNNVWIDHVDLSSDQDHDKDYYDGLLDVTHACDYITLSNSYLHDHWKASLVGHSDTNGSEDKGHLTVTYVGNFFQNLNSRGPSFRFGTGHIFNNYYENVSDGINTRQGAQLLVENNVFVGSDKPLYSTDAGCAIANGNDFGDGENTASAGTLKSMPYKYSLVAAGSVNSSVVGTAGATLTF
ncbi:pectin lyase fold/virulence factor [Tuber brumale]|nr:pectin lyase fold/virulence factor [Tuber brumale]